MKNFWIFIIIGFTCCTTRELNAQSDTVSLYQAYTSFTNQEKAEWTAFQNNWNYFNYNALKLKHHIHQLDCKSCESFYADLYIEINETGQVSVSACRMVKRCGISSTDLILKQDFEDSVRQQVFKILKHKKFMVRFGHVLKC